MSTAHGGDVRRLQVIVVQTGPCPKVGEPEGAATWKAVEQL